jgi:hypothetical protein
MINLFAGLIQFLSVTNSCGFIPDFFSADADTAIVRKTTDFEITGSGNNIAWDNTNWLVFSVIHASGTSYESKGKILYSDKGIYLLFAGEDQAITTKDYKDDEDIYEGDVFEFFAQPDDRKPPYFEYEINQLGRQLVLILSGSKNKNLAWSPWRHEYEKHPLIVKKIAVTTKSKKAELVEGNNAAIKPGAAIQSWTAEIFIPYEVLGLLPELPPKSGMIWRGNFCRIDYDNNKIQEWSWSKKIQSNFHDLKNFGYLIFE